VTPTNCYAATMPLRLLPLLCLALACGPKNPDAETGDPGSTGLTTATTATTENDLTSTGEVVTTSGELSTSTGPASTQTGVGDTSTGTTSPGVCVVDPAQGLCSDACDFFADCCGCDDTVLVLDPRAPSCVLPLGVVADECPWQPGGLKADDQFIPQLSECGEDGAVDGWTLEIHDGDQWIEL
jgi:hypothetical protein